MHVPDKRHQFGGLVRDHNDDNDHEQNHADLTSLRGNWGQVTNNSNGCHHNEEGIEKVDIIRIKVTLIASWGLLFKHAFHVLKPVNVACEADN
jgi:hypothetical protein